MGLALNVFDVVGIIGVSLIVSCYLLLQLRKVTGQGVIYSLLNGIGAGFVLISLCDKFNLAAFVIESFWLLISVIGLVIAMRGSRTR